MMSFHGKKEIYGVTTLGEKGQVVIPAEARETMGLEKGQKLLVFSLGSEMVAFTKMSDIEELAKHLSQKLEGLQELIKKNQETE